MMERIFELARREWSEFIGWLGVISESISDINPTQRAVLWIQLTAGLLTVIWIIYQFTWLRRLNEARLEKYLEDRIATEREDLAQERSETLTVLGRAAKGRGLRYSLLILWVDFRLVISFLLRMLSLGNVRGLTDHTPLLLQVGMLRSARRIYTEVARDAMRKIKLYEDARTNKCGEAQNALIFAGRIAVLEGRPATAVSAFRRATRIKDDPDARLFIGEQLAIASDFEGALNEYRCALADPSVRPSTKAELHRSIAKVLIEQGFPGQARRELTEAAALDEPARDYLGMGKTEELLGDLRAPKPRFRNAAIASYDAAISHFEHADDQPSAARVRRKLRKLRGPTVPRDDDVATRVLDLWARALLRIVERRRAQASRKED